MASIWGSLGVVKAALNGIREVVKDHRPGYTILLSGQCYPIKSNEYIYSFLKDNYGYNFIQGFELPDPRWPSSRLEKYAFFFSSSRADILEVEPLADLSLKSLLKKTTLIKYAKVLIYYPLKARLLLQRRRHPQNLKPYGGIAYWALPLQTLEFITQFVAQNPAYLDFHSFTLYPDEMFFQTIVHNYFTNVRESVTFAYWANSNVISPQTFTADQFAFVKERKELFARKFDYTIDTKILDLIDEELIHSVPLLE